ncbi:MAG: ADOP family duplicated permease, partial [Longimicrobiales bacterium]
MTDPGRRGPLDFGRRSAERIRREVDEELAYELDMRTAELVREGCDEAEARRRAVAEFGDLEATRRYCADVDRAGDRARRRTQWLAELRQDVRLTLRSLRREPAFALVVLFTLALGIGANTAVFSVLQKVLIDRLPYAEPDRLVRLYGGIASVPDARTMLRPAEIAAMQEQSRVFTEVAAFGNYGGMTYVGDRTAELWSGVQVGPEFFHLLGVPPLLGRVIDARDTGPDAVPVVVLSHGLWRRTFAGDSSVVGRQILLNDRARTVVGVMPPSFVSPDRDPEVWTPLDLTPLLRDPVAAVQTRIFRGVGRTADGVGAAGVRAALSVIAPRILAAAPGLRDVAPPSAVPLRDDMVGDVRPILLVVMGAAALVLLLCCVNLASLLLSRATVRRRELAIRTALGAGRARIVRQLLTESAVLGLAGGAIGVALAFWRNRTLVEVVTLMLPSVQEAPIDVRVLAFAVAISLLSAVVVGVMPAVASTRVDPQGALVESSRGASGGRASRRTSSALVGVQAALAVVLLICAGLLGRTLVALERTGVGFDTGPDVLTFGVNLSSAEYEEPVRKAAFFDQYLDRIRSLPGVRAAGAVRVSAWNGYTSMGPDSLFVEGQPDDVRTSATASKVTVSDGYFTALGIPVRQGRAFSRADGPGALPVALVSESLARRYWPGASPIGRRLRIGERGVNWLHVVGVVGDVRARPWQQAPPTVYLPMRQNPVGGAELVVRNTGNSLALVPAVRRELRRIDPELPVAAPRTLEDVFDDMLAGQRLPLLVTGAFAVLALLLAAVGVYSVLSYSV